MADIGYVYGCDIVGYTKFSHDQKRENLSRLNIVVEKVKNIVNNSSVDEGRIFFLDKGDGVYVVSIGADNFFIPLKAAACFVEDSKSLPFTLRHSINSGSIEIINEDGVAKPFGNAIDNTERMLSAARAGQILINFEYLLQANTHKHEFKFLKHGAAIRFSDKHDVPHTVFNIYHESVQIGIQIPDNDVVFRRIDRDQFVFESLSVTKSWLSSQRKTDVLSKYRSHILSGDMLAYRRSYKHSQPLIVKNRIDEQHVPAWTALGRTHSDTGRRLIIGLSTSGCTYRQLDPLKIGCFHCGFFAGLKPLARSVIEASLWNQFRVGLDEGRQAGVDYDVIEFLGDGSFLDDGEIPESTKKRIFSAIRQKDSIKRILIEGRSNFFRKDRDELTDRISDLRDDQILEIGIGFETSDDFIRQACLNKGSLSSEFEELVTVISRMDSYKKTGLG